MDTYGIMRFSNGFTYCRAVPICQYPIGLFERMANRAIRSHGRIHTRCFINNLFSLR
jgi:hypothetical protein